MSDTSGRSSPEPLAHYDPASSCWRMYGGMFPSDLMPSLATFPASGMTHAGKLYELPTPEHRTDEPASSSLLPTPDANTGDRGPRSSKALARGDRQTNINDLPRLLPTPKTTDENSASPGDARRNSPGLRAIDALLPTSAVNDMGEGKTPEAWDEWSIEALRLLGAGIAANPSPPERTVTTAEPVLLPTPTAMDSAGSRNCTAYRGPDARAVATGTTLTDWAWLHEGYTDPKLRGEPTNPRFDDGND